MVDSDGIAAELHAIAERIARSGQGDWVDAWRSGDAVTTDQAAMISRLGVKGDALSKMPEIDSFEELLTFMQSEGILDSKN